MNIQIVSLFAQAIDDLQGFGVVGRAVDAGVITLGVCDPREFAQDTHRTVDDRPYGGGPGMLLKYEPVVAAIRKAKAKAPGARTIYLSPQGQRLTQATAARLAKLPALVLVAGRYEGIDERIIEAEIDEELSLGDFVLSGGELAAMVVIDCVARLLDGVLGHEDSAAHDSFSDGLLDCPHYTRPPSVESRDVPAVLMSGDHAKIAQWRRQQALGRTWQRRPELLDEDKLSGEDKRLLEAFKAEAKASAGG